MLKSFNLFSKNLNSLENTKLLINTLNAYSYTIAQKDVSFREALQHSDVLLPDGISVVKALKFLNGSKLTKIAGSDLFQYEMERMQEVGGSVFFLGSHNTNLAKIKQRAALEYPAIKVYGYSPPFKDEFSEADNQAMLHAINTVQPQVLFIGMTAPKQEKWAYRHFQQVAVGHVCCIGAVFDFYAATVTRAPQWIINIGLEWLYRFLQEPRRMWRRYLLGNSKFIYYILVEKIRLTFNT